MIKSSAYSCIASILSYAITIILARNESQIAFAEFAYAITWALILTQVVDLAATQCVTHFKVNTKENVDVILSSVYWAKLVSLFVILSSMVVMRLAFNVDVPFLALFFFLPAFYFGPIFEIRSLNVLFAKILFAEKAAVVLFCYFYLKSNPLDIFVYAAYFSVSVASLTYQFFVLDLKPSGLLRVSRVTVSLYCARYWPIFLTLASQVAYGHISRIIIEAKFGLLIFGSVSLALQIVNAVSIIQTQVDRHLRLMVAEVIDSSNFGGLSVLSVRYALIYLVPLFLGCLLLYFSADEAIVFLFSQKWVDAAGYLKYLLPVIITAAILRYLDIVVVGLGIGRVNLVINLLAALILVCSLWFLLEGRPVHDYLLMIVGVQILHIVMVGAYVARKLSGSKGFVSV